MDILEKLVKTQSTKDSDVTPKEGTKTKMKVSIVDGMAEVQALDKPSWVKNCSQLAEHFSTRIFDKYGGSDEVQLIFDR